jgi:hypothetical protein
MQKPSHSFSREPQLELVARAMELAPGRRRLAWEPFRWLRLLKLVAAPRPARARMTVEPSILGYKIEGKEVETT